MLKLIQIIRDSIYAILGGFDYMLGRTNPITILAYHGIASNDWRFTVSKETFSQQVKLLKQKYTIISLSELEGYLNSGKSLKKPCVAITFDDGYKNILTIKDVVKQMGIKPTVFILSQPARANVKEMGLSTEFLTPKDVRSLIADGWTIGSHGATHPDFATLSKDQITKEISGSKKIIENITHKKIRYFAYPKGRYTKDIVSAIKKAKYSLAFSMDDAKITKNSSVLNLPRVGIDKSHSISQFQYAFCPSVINFRRFVKNSPLSKFATL